MTLSGGTYELGPDDGTVVVETGREGAAAVAGHDLTIGVARWSATVTVNARSPSRSTVSASVDPASLRVLASSGGVAPLSEGQKADIVRNIRESVLHTDRHRTITFKSTAVEGDLRSGRLTGNLTLVGRTRPVTFDVAVKGGRGTTRTVTATTDLTQSDFGITPYAALLGQLRVKDVVRVTVTLRLPAQSSAGGPARGSSPASGDARHRR